MFHHITRRPLIVKGDLIIISPEILLDSIFTNTHYTLIESSENKHEYISKCADLYLDILVKIAAKYGYSEVKREVDLFEGKNQIGDIDLILKNDSGEFLLIEAKNHTLPLDVYFKDLEKTKKHLDYLQEGWEKKVMRRVSHLENFHLNYSIPETYEYLIVSKFPEVISHFSELLVLSSHEFDEWLKRGREHKSFDKFFESISSDWGNEFSSSEIKQLQENKMFFGKFEEPKN